MSVRTICLVSFVALSLAFAFVMCRARAIGDHPDEETR